MTRNREKFPRDLIFQPQFLEDLKYWVEKDRKIAVRLLELVEAVRRDPFKGIGKPEPLKHLQGSPWSRRLTSEHRVVYLVTGEEINFLQGRYHY